MWHKTGTASFTNGSTAVTGVGTSWIANVGIGEAILAPDGNLYEVSSINSNTSITLGSTYLGTTQSGVSYVIVPTQSYIRDLASQAATLVNSYSGISTTVALGRFTDGTVAAPGVSFSGDQDTGLFRSGTNEVTLVANGVAVAKWGTTGLSILSGSAPIVSAKIGPSASQQHSIPAVTADTFTLNAATQTITNKTIALGSNTVSGTLAQFNTAVTDADFASLAGYETLTNKTINLTSNTLSGTTAQFNAALSDNDFATLAGSETLTNKTITAPTISGGSIDNTPIGGTTPAAGAFTSLSATLNASINGNAYLAYDGSQFTQRHEVNNFTPQSVYYRWVGSASDYWSTRVLVDDKYRIQTAAIAGYGAHTYADRVVIDGAGLSVTGALSATVNQNAETDVTVTNTTVGTTSVSAFLAQSDSTNTKFGTLSSGFTTNGALVPNAGFVLNGSSGGLSLLAPSGPIRFATGGLNTTATLDTSGNLGLGVTPSVKTLGKAIDVGAVGNGVWCGPGYAALTLNTTYNSGYKYVADGVAGLYTIEDAHRWFTAPSGAAGAALDVSVPKMTLDMSGNLLVGATGTQLGAAGRVELSIKGGALGAYTTYTDSSGFAGYLGGVSSGMTLATVASSPLVFATNSTERARIDSSGNLLVGTTTLTTTPTQGIVNYAGSSAVSCIGHTSGTASGNGYSLFSYNGILIGSITQNGTTAVAYNTTSDHRLKENVRPANAARFMDIEFVDFEWIDGRHDCGVIAHQLQSVYPDLVIGEKDATEIRQVEISPAIPAVTEQQLVSEAIPAVEEELDEEGNVIVEAQPAVEAIYETVEIEPAVEAVYEDQTFPVYQQVNYIGLIGRMGTTIQKQQRMLEAMEARLAALEAA